MSPDDPTGIKPEKKARSLARMRRYRARIRRIDYVPRPDVLAIIEHYMTKHPKNRPAGVIDALIRRGHEAVSGNAGR